MSATLLFIGGTGEISSAAVLRALTLGHRVTILNRGRSTMRPIPEGVEVIRADIRQPAQVAEALAGREFDVVVDFFAFLPEHIDTDVRLFSGRTGHYVFISSASAYQTPPERLPVTEDTPLANPLWQYSREKIACEARLQEAAAARGLAWTIVRPSHTYDRTSIPFDGGWTVVDRMRRRLPVVVHGDGTSLWTITHADDVAVGLVGLLGQPRAFGEAYHITNEAPITWDRIYTEIARAAGAEPVLRHLPSEIIAAHQPDWGPRLLGDVSHSMVFDNSKIAALVPDFDPTIDFTTGAAQIVDWYDRHPERQQPDAAVAEAVERLCRVHERALPSGGH